MLLQLFHISDETTGIIDVFDSWGSSLIGDLRGDWTTGFIKIVSDVFDPLIVMGVALVIVLFFLVKRMRFEAIMFGGSVAAAAALVLVLKHIVGRPRPLNALIEETGYSFPSGHALVSTVFFLVLYFICKKRLSSVAMRKTLFALALVMPILIGMSRIYLGVHHSSDVLGGFVLGSIIVSIIILRIEGHSKKIKANAVLSAPTKPLS